MELRGSGLAQWSTQQGITQPAADARYVKKNTLQVNATDFIKLGVAPGATALLNIDSNFAIGVYNGATLVGTLGRSGSNLVLQGQSAGASLILAGAAGNQWSIPDAAGVSGFKALQTVAHLIGGATSSSLRNNADTLDNLLIADGGQVSLGGVTQTLSLNGSITFPSSISLSNGTGHAYAWNGRTQISCPADGVVEFQNSTGTGFSRLQFGGTTNAFSALKTTATALVSRLADDSAFAFLQGKLQTDNAFVGGVIAPTGSLIIYDSAGNPRQVPAL